MTREEQIRKYAEEKCVLYDNIGFDGDVYSLVVETIEWADKTMIDKASKWLGNFLKGPMGEGLANSIVDEFRKAMEE